MAKPLSFLFFNIDEIVSPQEVEFSQLLMTWSSSNKSEIKGNHY